MANEELKACPLCECSEIEEADGGTVARCGDELCEMHEWWIPQTEWQNRPIEDKLRAEIEESRKKVVASNVEYENSIADRDDEIEDLKTSIRHLLPLAKGYVATRNVGINRQIINTAISLTEEIG